MTDDDRLEVIYSTKDGQLTDQAIPLELSEDGFNYVAKLRPSESGIQQDLTYRVEAGDAATRDFEVTTLEAPSIDVTSLRYEFPAYTGESPWQQDDDGHIRALEGSMVTIRAKSNRPIQKAYLEFDPIEDFSGRFPEYTSDESRFRRVDNGFGTISLGIERCRIGRQVSFVPNSIPYRRWCAQSSSGSVPH